ncbi:hypothetical protein [Salinarimonas soli]|uniref:Uncharacterized protein n=1 Tax=Salinarimonas soli TaxID=1638099 RepID=A0A5B2W0X9_9HYPH|nr:hypothetical protein [Salinarimonas soli]KAA2244390.1 hypothetical protein F0L46_00375 [Salinarimonas soli]
MRIALLALAAGLALAGEAAALGNARTKSGVIACSERVDWTRLSRLIEKGDDVGVRRFMTTRILGQDCRRFYGSRPVFVQIRSVNAICIRPMGEAACLWTAPESVE